MNKLFVITVLVALLAINAESFRVARQAEEEIASEVAPEEPIASEVAPEEPIASEVAAEEPIASEVAAEEPIASEVAAEEPFAGEVAAEEPIASEVAAEEPIASEIAVDPIPSEIVEEKGTLSKISTSVKSYYNHSVDTASGYLESIRGLKLEEKAKNLYEDTTRAMKTYAGILQDQVYHTLYAQQ